MLSSSSQWHVFVMDRHVVSLICKKRQEKVVSLTRYSNLSRSEIRRRRFCIEFFVFLFRVGKRESQVEENWLEICLWNRSITLSMTVAASIGLHYKAGSFCATTATFTLCSLLDWSLNGRGESPLKSAHAAMNLTFLSWVFSRARL